MESSVSQSDCPPCEQDPEEEGVRSFRLQKSRPCAQSSVAVRITPPRFSSSLCTDAVAASTTFPHRRHTPYPAIDPQGLGNIGNNSHKRFGTGDLQTGAFNSDSELVTSSSATWQHLSGCLYAGYYP
ncbi:unnamed protein product [Sphagnum tenellum]